MYYIRGVSNVDNRYAFRIDHEFSQSDRIFGRFTRIPLTSARFFGIAPTSPADSSPTDQSWSSDFALNETHVFSSSLINELRLMYMRNRQLRAEQGLALTKDWGASFGLTPATIGVGFPSVGIGYSFNGIGYGSGALQQVDENYQFLDDLTWTHGPHTIRMGVDIRRLQSNQINLAGLYGGTYSFSSNQTNNGGGGNALASLDLGLISGFSNTPVEVPAYYRWHYYAGYIQDDYKIRPNLTLNLGLRYDVETPRIEKYNEQGTFIPSLTGTLNGLPATGAFCFSGSCGLSTSIWPTNFLAFEPRIGVAWSPSRRMTVRASYNILRIPLSGQANSPNPNLNVASNSIGGTSGGIIANQPVDYITNPVGPLTSALSALNGRGPFFGVTPGITYPWVEQNNVAPYAMQWGATMQYQIDPKTMIQVSYNGLRGVHLMTSFSPELNAPDIPYVMSLIAKGYNFNTTIPNPYKITNVGSTSVNTENELTALAPYQNFYNQTLSELYNRAGSSSYHALYFNWTHRMGYGLTLQGSFAWAKSIDSTGNDPTASNVGAFAAGSIQYPTNLKLDRSVSAFDIPAKFTVGYSYQLPLGHNRLLSTHVKVLDALIGHWSHSGTVNVQSGQPFEPVLGGSGYWVSSGGGTGLNPAELQLRPNVVPGVPCISTSWRQNPFGVPYINWAAFSMPGSLGAPALGDAPRSMTNCRSPRVVNFNGSLRRRIPLGKDEKRSLDIGVEVQNIFNHPVFFMPGNSDNSAYNAFNTASLTNSQTPAFTNQSSFGGLSAGNTEGLSRTAQISLKLHF